MDKKMNIMRTKKYFILVFLIIGVQVQAQIRGQVQFNREAINTMKENSFDKIITDENLFIEDPGSPELPILLKSYLIPVDADKVTVNVQNESKQEIKGQYNVYPAQPPVLTGNVNSIFTTSNPKIYESNNPYPGKQAEIISDGIYMGYRIITVRLYPVEYIPQAKKLYVCSFDFSLDYSINTKNAKNIQTQSLYRYELNKKAAKFRVENPEAADNYDTKVQKVVQGKTVVYNFSASSGEKTGLRSQSVSVLDEQVPDYIIITCDSLKSAFQQLAGWKTKKGVFTVIATVEEINAGYSGSDLQEKIRNYLLNANSKWGPGLFVLLGGDIDIIPSRFVKSTDITSPLSYPSDKYYSTLSSWSIYNGTVFNGNTSTSMMNILGRVPISNSQEIAIYTNKIVTYEKANGLGDLNYLKNNLYSDAYMFEADDGNLSDFAINSIRDSTSRYVPSFNNKFICDNAFCQGNTSKYSPSVYCNNNGCCNGDIELNHDNFLSCLNTGANLGVGKFHFIYHMDHGSAFNIGTSSKDKGQDVKRVDMDNLTNGPSFQIFMTSSCNSANFQFDCFAKHYIMNPNGGGVAYIGNTDSGWTGEYTQLVNFQKALYSTIYPKYCRYDIGSAYQYASERSSDSNNNGRLHLLGDPEMQVWTNVPQTLNVALSTTSLQVGQRSIDVTLSNLSLPLGESATICVQKGTEVYEIQSVSDNGTYTFPVSPETTGTMDVTVTAHNYIPSENTVQVTSSTTPYPIISTVNFVDNGTNNSIGNSDGQNDAGETICLQVTLKNTGGATANNLTATLSSTSNYISVLNNSSTTGSIAPNDSAVAQFLYTIDKNAPEILSNDTIPVQFKLDLKDASNTTWTKTFNIDVFATDLQQRNKITPVQPFSANQTVSFDIELQNIGQAPTNGLTAVLTSNNATNIVSSCPNTAHSYPSIGNLETKTAATSFQFTTGSSYTSGTTLNFTLMVTDAYGKIDTFPFNLTSPPLVSNLQASANGNAINLYWTAVPGLSYNIYRYNVDSAGNASGNYVRINNVPITSDYGYYSDASDLSPLTKYYYTVTSISSSGMESDTVGILTWTSYSTQGLYPVFMNALNGSTMNSNFVAEDVNNDGKKEIFTALSGGDSGGVGDLIALDWEGKELFDIDNNVTTYSGFAHLNEAIRAGVAIADINQDGINEIVSVTRGLDSSNQNNKITCHIAYDNNGDNKPYMLWQIPTQRTFMSGAILDNLDNSPDGLMEVVVVPDGNAGAYQTPQIYDAQGNLLLELPIGSGSATYGAAAVADLDGDGNKEIIAGRSDGVYIWRNDGTPYGQTNPFFTLSGYNFGSSPVVCDINNDGKKEILLSAFSTLSVSSCRIFAINTSGQLLAGWGTTGSNSYISTSNNDYTNNLTKEIAVGDLNEDGKLEVVAVGANGINIWNSDGSLSKAISVSGLESQFRSPLIADVDGDSEAEIIVTSYNESKIYAYKSSSGNAVVGFPLETSSTFEDATPVIADLDGDGKSEISAGTGDKKIYVWKTNGDPNRIEWGSARHDARNTGEYFKVCDKTVINSDTLWSSNIDVCNDIVIVSGTLTLNSSCTLNMNGSSTIIVRPGANLVIDGGIILNANIRAMSQSSVTIKNSGNVKIRKNGEFNILLGATFDNQQGIIDISQ